MSLATRARALLARLGSILRERARDRDLQIAGAVSLGTILVLALTATQGFVRDEGYYFRAAADYHRWFEGLWRNLWAGRLLESFSDTSLTRAFGYNTEHPGLVKILMGFTWKVFHQWLGWTSHGTGYRLASIGLVGIGNGFLYLLGAGMMSRRVGLLAVALLLASPHVFYHFHLACFDGPIVAATVAVVYAFWRSLESRPWILGAGIVWGLAVATKHNAVFLVPTLALAFFLARLHEVRLTRDLRLSLPPIPWAFFAMALLGPILFYIFYPYGWHDPIGRIQSYYHYHLHHEHYPVDYFGTLFTEPPFPISFPFVMSALTVPLVVLVPGVVGWGIWFGRALRSTLASWRGQSSETPAVDAWLLVINTLVPVAIIAVPSVPIFGGTKHWMPMMPFLCLLSAWVIVEALERAVSWLPRGRRVAAVVGVILVLAVPVAETARSHPLGHTYFNELALGHAGGAALGMPRTFWGGDARELLPVLNEQAGQRATVFCDRMNYDDFRAYQKDELLRSDLRWSGDVRSADWAFINHQREFQDNEYKIWALTGDRRPVATVAFDGTPIVSLYRVRARPPAKKRVALVVLDGFGLGEPGPGNAVAQALASRPEGLLARALVNDELPWVALGASGECVGLPPGMNGNSEAGHGAMCAGAPVEQARVTLDRLVQAPEQAAGLLARAEQLAAAGKPLHVIVYLAANSSVGHYEHVLVPLRLSRRAGVPQVWIHGVCDGRDPGGCTPIAERVAALAAREGIGRFATIAGRKSCWSRTGLDDGVRACVANMTSARTGGEPELAAVLAATSADDDGHSHLEPTALAGSPALGANDEVWILPYRRDVLRGAVQALRTETGPEVVTVSYLDAESRYASDPRLVLGLERSTRGGMLHRELAHAGVRELRVSEAGKAGHVTYFCDGGDVPEDDYVRVHAPSVEDYAEHPCLSSAASVRTARDAVARDEADFILMNLPNADILGHTSEVAVAVEGIHCAERLLESFVREATVAGFSVFITADHGNAEDMLTDGELNHEHTANPVPFVAIAPRGAKPFALRRTETPECLGAAAWTVLDALGLKKSPQSLLLP